MEREFVSNNLGINQLNSQSNSLMATIAAVSNRNNEAKKLGDDKSTLSYALAAVVAKQQQQIGLWNNNDLKEME